MSNLVGSFAKGLFTGPTNTEFVFPRVYISCGCFVRRLLGFTQGSARDRLDGGQHAVLKAIEGHSWEEGTRIVRLAPSAAQRSAWRRCLATTTGHGSTISATIRLDSVAQLELADAAVRVYLGLLDRPTVALTWKFAGCSCVHFTPVSHERQTSQAHNTLSPKQIVLLPMQGYNSQTSEVQSKITG